MKGMTPCSMNTQRFFVCLDSVLRRVGNISAMCKKHVNKEKGKIKINVLNENIENVFVICIQRCLST